ncbi:hypothetical protein, partial [Enterobacter hormaechei]
FKPCGLVGGPRAPPPGRGRKNAAGFVLGIFLSKKNPPPRSPKNPNFVIFYIFYLKNLNVLGLYNIKK